MIVLNTAILIIACTRFSLLPNTSRCATISFVKPTQASAMPYDLSSSLVIGISSRALFNLEEENRIFEASGVAAYAKYQREHENEMLIPGNGFPLVKALLGLNAKSAERRLVEVIIMSRNSPDLGIRIFKSIEHHGLDISRAAFSSGSSLAAYLESFSVDLFLSKSEEDVQAAVNSGFAGAVIYEPPDDFNPDKDEIRIAFDGDAVLFSEESERIYQEQGLEAFLAHERENAGKPLPEGPFAKLLKTLSFLQSEFSPTSPAVRIALVTARNSPAHERVIRTLREWDVRIDEAFFLGGVSKKEILRAFRPLMFFDDQDVHLNGARQVVPAARVPCPSNG